MSADQVHPQDAATTNQARRTGRSIVKGDRQQRRRRELRPTDASAMRRARSDAQTPWPCASADALAAQQRESRTFQERIGYFSPPSPLLGADEAFLPPRPSWDRQLRRALRSTDERALTASARQGSRGAPQRGQAPRQPRCAESVSAIRRAGEDAPSSCASGTAGVSRSSERASAPWHHRRPSSCPASWPSAKASQRPPTGAQAASRSVRQPSDAPWPCGPRAARESAEGSAPGGRASEATYGRDEHEEGRQDGEQLEDAVHLARSWPRETGSARSLLGVKRRASRSQAERKRRERAEQAHDRLGGRRVSPWRQGAACSHGRIARPERQPRRQSDCRRSRDQPAMPRSKMHPAQAYRRSA